MRVFCTSFESVRSRVRRDQGIGEGGTSGWPVAFARKRELSVTCRRYSCEPRTAGRAKLERARVGLSYNARACFPRDTNNATTTLLSKATREAFIEIRRRGIELIIPLKRVPGKTMAFPIRVRFFFSIHFPFSSSFLVFFFVFLLRL